MKVVGEVMKKWRGGAVKDAKWSDKNETAAVRGWWVEQMINDWQRWNDLLWWKYSPGWDYVEILLYFWGGRLVFNLTELENNE